MRNTRSSPARSRFATRLVAGLGAVALATTLAACASSDASESGTAADGSITVGAVSNGAATETSITVSTVESIRAKVPQAIRDKGTLVVGLGLLPSGSVPLGFTGSDQKTLTGSEPDIGRLIAAVLGLEPVLDNATWENLFVGIDSGKTDVGLSNITDTEKRKEKYDFASYRQDNLGFEVLKSSDWNFDGDYENLAGQTVAVGAGTNQEKILLEWQTKLKAEGKTLDIKYFPEANSTYLALSSGEISAYFAPNPSIAYHVTQTASSPSATRAAGTFSGAGTTLQGLIAATTKKGNGLAEPLADAINYLIDNGQYAQWLKAWNLTNEAVPKSEVNPPGLPLDNA